MVCQVCDAIVSLLPGGSDDVHDVALGTIQDIRQSSCDVHPPLLIEALKLDSPTDVNDSIVGKRSAVHGEVFFHIVGDELTSGSYGWQKLGKEGEFGRINLVDNKRIDLNQIRTWKERCSSEHGHLCASSGSDILDQVRPAWLVDCAQKCLVRGDTKDAYIAFSYVWGQAQQFKLSELNLKDFQRPGALSAHEIQSRLPAGIRDVLSLTLSLQERYIWIDCLCIAQDDQTTKQQEILKMAGIYHNASLTIVLASALENGIKGLPDISGPRNLAQKTFKLNEENTLVQHLSARNDVRTDPWSRRAWTFQEGLFSHRIIEFQKETVFWRCQQFEWFEDVEEPEFDEFGDMSDERSVDNLREKLYQKYPSFPSTAELTRDYISRDLTYADDAHNAFSSTLAVMSRAFKGGFISGLPAVNFDLALLWLPNSPMTIRAGDQYTSSVLPSWSWISWQGQLDTVCWFKGYDHLVMTGKHLSASERVLPLVEWSIHDKKHEIYRKLPNEWLSLRKTYTTEDVNPPQGWMRHTFDPFAFLYSQEEDEVPNLFIESEDDLLSLNRPEMAEDEASLPDRYYTHESDSSARFWYPIPLPDPDRNAPAPVLATTIRCETRLARLYGAERFVNDRRDHGAITLRDQNGRFAGALRPNHWFPFLKPVNSTDCDKHNLIGTCFDLVEISLGYCYEDYWTEYPRSEPNIDEWKHRERPRRADGRYEFYNVMWVIWEDGIAYRRGIGRAEKALWQSLERQPISLILG